MSNRKICSLIGCLSAILFLVQCKKQEKEASSIVKKSENELRTFNKEKDSTPEGMVLIPAGVFKQGAVNDDSLAMVHEKPSHEVQVDGFFMDIHEVTNAEFSEFVAQTGYKTIAERSIDWEELKKQLPKETAKPADSLLKPGSLVFKRIATRNLLDYSQWWEWTIGANWKHPQGPESSIEGKENDPVVHIAYEDALAYCNWKGRRLPTEAEWEYAARGGSDGTVYFWGNQSDPLAKMANTWTGQFPLENNKIDGFEGPSPVKTYPPNGYGLYDMAGNVWEWTNDWYNSDYYRVLASNKEVALNPKGAKEPFNRNNPYAQERVIKGGSFLCNASYCASYRISSRMATSLDSAMEHLGFRTVKDLDSE